MLCVYPGAGDRLGAICSHTWRGWEMPPRSRLREEQGTGQVPKEQPPWEAGSRVSAGVGRSSGLCEGHR